MFAQSLGAAHTSPRAALDPGRPLLSILGPAPHPWLPSPPPGLPAPHPRGWALSHILLGSQLHTKGLCAHPSPCSRPLPGWHTKALPVPRPAAAQAQGLARMAWGNLPRSLPPPPGLGGSPSQGKGGGSSKAPIEHRPPTASHSRDPPASLPYVPLRLCCWSGGKKGEKKNKNQLLPFNI